MISGQNTTTRKNEIFTWTTAFMAYRNLFHSGSSITKFIVIAHPASKIWRLFLGIHLVKTCPDNYVQTYSGPCLDMQMTGLSQKCCLSKLTVLVSEHGCLNICIQMSGHLHTDICMSINRCLDVCIRTSGHPTADVWTSVYGRLT